jgi:hypothetical protein
VQESIEQRAHKELQKRRMRITANVIEALHHKPENPLYPTRVNFPMTPYVPPEGVCPDAHVLAMDSAQTASYMASVQMFSGLGFPGFPYLTELAQLTEYRDMSERMADQMTRKWIKLKSMSKQNKTEVISRLEADMRKFKVREAFHAAAVLDGEMGRAQIFIDLGEDGGKDKEELSTHLMLNKWKVKLDSLRRLKIVEPVTTYPEQYNSTNPLAEDYYKPSSWYVYGTKINATRMLTFIGRPLPNVLKPSYNFSGISLSQLAQPYVEYWLNTRNSIGNLLRNFSTSILQTNMQDILGGDADGSELVKRARLFTQGRDNQGVFLLDKDTENFLQINTPLSGLSDLQAQAQEHMAAVAKIPLVILLGISPKGLNASSEGELQTFYSYVNEMQEKLFRPNLEYLLKIMQLNAFGMVDEDITFDFVPLFEMSEQNLASIRKSDGDRDVALIGASVVSPEEVRAKLAADPNSGFDNLNAAQVQGTLTPTAPEGAEPGVPPAEGAEPSTQEELPVKDVARYAMDYAIQLTEDRSYYGNQTTEGGIGSKHENPQHIAMRWSGVARRATNVARRTGTRAAHGRAATAHQRALDAHQSALGSCSQDAAHIHDAYIAAHSAAIKEHSGGHQ